MLLHPTCACTCGGACLLLVMVLEVLLVLEVPRNFREISEMAISLIAFRQDHVHVGRRPLRAAADGDEMVARGRNRLRSAAVGHLLLAVGAGGLHEVLALCSSGCRPRCAVRSDLSCAAMPPWLEEVESRPVVACHHEASVGLVLGKVVFLVERKDEKKDE